MIATVVFDLDDTLYDEIDYCRSGFTAVADFVSTLPEALPAERIFGTMWKQFTAGNRKTTFNAALDELGIGYDGELVRQLVTVYRNHVPQITLPADSKSVLEQLSHQYTLALLTDGFLPAQKLKVKALGIGEYFKCIVYTEQLGRECWKPSPIGFEKLMADLNAKPEATAYVADNEEKDFIAPNKLGFVTIQIIRGARIPRSVSKRSNAAATYVIHRIGQLPGLLERVS
jgi:putative hydrolase of the HAD superfamily